MPRHKQNSTALSKKETEALSADVVQMLQQDHRTVERLFHEFESGDESRQEEVSQQLFKELEVHATLEEEIFYRALRSEADLGELGKLQQGDGDIDGAEVLNMDEEEMGDHDEDEETAAEVGEDVIDSVYEDHQAVRELIGRLQNLGSGSPDFKPAMTELQDMVMEHIAEEEEVLFAEARLRLDTQMIGRQMQERKQELIAPLS
jgi:hemerythrin superfamily protein